MDFGKSSKELSAPNCSRGRASNFSYISQFNKEQKQTFLDSFDIVFCDCDGVIWQTLRNAIPGSARAIDYLRQQGKHVTFVTNNSIISADDQLKKFENCGLKVDKGDIIHPAQSICDHLKSIEFEGLIFCIASTPFKNVLRESGLQLVEEKDRIISETVDDLRSVIYTKDPIKAVIIDVDFNLTAAKLMRAHVILKDAACLFIGGAADTIIPFGSGDVIGPGPFITVVEQSTKRKAFILGKPGKELGAKLKQRFHLSNPKRALFIGDSLTSDVKFGKMCGFQTLLVLTGGASESDLHAGLENEETPDFVAKSLADLYE